MKQYYMQNKRFRRILIPISFLFVITFSCNKVNNDVPIKPAATSNAPAAIVVPSVGPVSINNNVLYYSENCPESLIGNFGDYYLNTSQNLLYGPRTNIGWGNDIKILGPTAAGSKVLSGYGDPSSTIGNTADYYLNTSTFVLYGPKNTGGWSSSIDLTNQQAN
jgi:hypothetical protein